MSFHPEVLEAQQLRALEATGSPLTARGFRLGGGTGLALLLGHRDRLARLGPGGNMRGLDRIEVNPKVMRGKRVIRGTRIPVELLLRKLGEGATVEELLDAYPRLSREDIQAALAYAGSGSLSP